MKRKEMIQTFNAEELENHRDAGGFSATIGGLWGFSALMVTLVHWDSNWDWTEWSIAGINIVLGILCMMMGFSMLDDADEEKARRRNPTSTE